jgi:hypothetical protein
VAYVPNYYGDVLEWDYGWPVVTATMANPYNIQLDLTSPITPGPGSISGKIIGGGLDRSLTEQVNMLFTDGNYKVLGFTDVNSSGEFAFPDLAYGTYNLKADLPGYYSYYTPVLISAEHPHAEVYMGFNGNSIMGTGETEEAGLKVYPNPVSEQLRISLNANGTDEVILSLFNLTGQMVYQEIKPVKPGQNTFSIPAGELPAGVYTLRVSLDDGMSFGRKVVVAK